MADNQKFKHYLALLHLGVDKDVLSENGIDVTDSSFQELRNKFIRCCVQHTIDIAKKEGDEEMEKLMADYWIDEGIEIGIERGREQGQIYAYHGEMKLSFEEISKKMNIPLNKVIETLKTL